MSEICDIIGFLEENFVRIYDNTAPIYFSMNLINSYSQMFIYLFICLLKNLRVHMTKYQTFLKTRLKTRLCTPYKNEHKVIWTTEKHHGDRHDNISHTNASIRRLHTHEA